MSRYKLIFASSVQNDFERIAEHLFRNYVFFGETPASAVNHVEQRISELRDFTNSLQDTPHQGTCRNDLRKGLRMLPDQRNAAFAFEVDDQNQTVKILRIFFGGEDYDAVMRDM